ncbi:progesterone-induced-blocking factor 1-like [Clytia hemisphaerica]|uniref:Progesterone-induced-blocking factor 1 n=1 Tax=Clytia hemisphaerica TaxID=252671 RepID=A0A7M5V9S8_9CNID|eukprot:TCONS_00053700-protein
MDSDSKLTVDALSSTNKTNDMDDDSTLLTTNITTTIGQSTNGLSNITELESTNISGTLTDTATGLLSSLNLSESDMERSRNVTKDLLFRKQLLHDIQKLKIELSQKNLMIDTLKAEHLNQLDDLEEKLADAIHGRQLMQAKYETQSRSTKSELDKHVQSLKKDLQEAMKSQKYYQRKYEDEMNNQQELNTFREGYIPRVLDEDAYLELKSECENTLSIKNLFDVKLYEATRPLRVEVDSLQQRLDLFTSDFHDKEQELEAERNEREEERHLRAELDLRCQRYQVQLEQLRGQVDQKSYKHQNYDLVQSERDALERQIVDLERACTVYKAELEGRMEQNEIIRNQVLEQNQTVALLKQDKEYLSKQLNELEPRHKMVEEKLHHTMQQLDETKQARESLYEKYLNSRERYKQEYEERMKREIDELSNKTNTELDRIKENMKAMYERENRGLVEARNTALLEQERLLNNEKNNQIKYNELLGEFRQLQISSDSKVSDVHNDFKMKAFEHDRVQLLYEESLNNNKALMQQNDALSQKIEAVNKGYYDLKTSSQKSVTELTSKNEDLKNKLTIYEKLEQELDDVVMQAAEMTDEGDSERVLFAYGYGANVPSTAKRRMQQSVQLARRVLHLERTNTSLRHEVERESKKSKQVSEELHNANNLLNEAQQPYNYLIESIRTRDEQNKTLKNTIETLEGDMRTCKKENQALKTSNDQISADLERLLNQREELGVLKQVVLGLKSSGRESLTDHSLSNIAKTSSTVYGPHVSKRTTSQNENNREGTAPKPIVFEKSVPPSWYTRLKSKNNQSSLRRPKPT